MYKVSTLVGFHLQNRPQPEAQQGRGFSAGKARASVRILLLGPGDEPGQVPKPSDEGRMGGGGGALEPATCVCTYIYMHVRVYVYWTFKQVLEPFFAEGVPIFLGAPHPELPPRVKTP